MESLFSNIAAGLITAFILFVAGGLLSRRFRSLAIALLGILVESDVVEIFPTQRAASADISRSLARASRVCVLTGRGGELQRETFAPLWDSTKGHTRTVMILLPATQPKDHANWVGDRESEIATFDSAYRKPGVLTSQIEAATAFVESHSDGQGTQLRRYNAPHLGRIILTEDYAYLTPYRADQHGRDSPTIKYRAGGHTFRFLQRMFDKYWIAAIG
jgi:hypothetical protein